MLRDDGASFLVVGAIVLAVFAFLGGTVLEVGQWFEHRRNLQVRTDAAALAGGVAFNECLAGTLGASTHMEQAAAQYSGIPGSVTLSGGSTVAGVYNKAWQAGTPGNDAIGFQSNEYPTLGGALPPRDAFDSSGSDECSNLELDVKQTQQLPNLLSISPFSKVHGWARVELQTVIAERPSLPLAIPNFNLNQVGVTFVDETTGGNELQNCTGSIVAGGCTFALSLASPSDVTGVDLETATKWTLAPVTINLPSTPSANGDLIGVRVSTGASVGSCANTQGTNDYSCEDITQTGSGVVGIRYFSASQSTTPALYEVWPSSCSPDTSPFFSDLDIAPGGPPSCSVTLQAKIVNAAGCGTNPEALNPPATLIANMPAGNSITMHATGGCDAHGWLWSGTSSLPLDASSTQSEYPVSLTYKRGGTTKTWSNAQRFTSANFDDDGPVRMVSLSGAGNPYSTDGNGNHTDTVGVTVVVSREGITHQLVVLRGSHNGSSTAFILCYDNGSGSPYSPEQGDPGIKDAMQNGCSFEYAINPTSTCPDPGGAMPLPADCVPNKTSAAGGNPLVKTPLNARFGCSNSPPTHPNYWPNYGTDPSDPRAVTLLLTSYNAYADGGQQNGRQTYPVEGFGAFYITGFDGDACAGDDPAPPVAAQDNPNAGDIWGYFIGYSGGGVPSGKKCKLNTFEACVPALVR
jgi:hypothetical protein